MTFSRHWRQIDFGEVKERILNTSAREVSKALRRAGQAQLSLEDLGALLSPAAAYVTGTLLDVSGGR